MSLQGSKIGGAGCGCGMSGGSGYGVKLGSSAMLLGPQSGYGAIDPYRGGIVNSGSSLSYPALDTKAMRGGKKSRSRKSSSSSKRVFFNIKSKSKKSKKVIKSKKNSSRKIRHKSSKRHNIKKQMKQKGGELSFSDYVSSASVASAPQVVGQIASSPNYGVNVSELSPKMSALANPVRVTPGNNCSK
jgi:hypothetical protein